MKRILFSLLICASASAQVVNFKVVSSPGVSLPSWVYSAKGSIEITDSNGVVTKYDATITRASGVTSVETPTIFELKQNYPNPFNPGTMITYDLARESRVNLSIYDQLGQKVLTLVDQVQPVGPYSVRFDGTGYASGVYYCQLKAGDFVQTKKIMLFR